MFICPVCSKLFSMESAMKGHLRLSNDYRHVAYTGRKISRKHVRVASSNLSKQTINDLLERMSSLEAKFNALNKPPQQPVPNNETPAVSPNSPGQTDSIVGEVLHRLEAKDYGQNRSQRQPVTSGNQSQSTAEVLLEYLSKQEAKDKPQNKPQQPVTITESPTVLPPASQPKPTNWQEYLKDAESSHDRDDYFYSHEALNDMVKRGYSPDLVSYYAQSKTYRGKQKEEEEDQE